MKFEVEKFGRLRIKDIDFTLLHGSNYFAASLKNWIFQGDKNWHTIKYDNYGNVLEMHINWKENYVSICAHSFNFKENLNSFNIEGKTVETPSFRISMKKEGSALIIDVIDVDRK